MHKNYIFYVGFTENQPRIDNENFESGQVVIYSQILILMSNKCSKTKLLSLDFLRLLVNLVWAINKECAGLEYKSPERSKIFLI